MISSNYTSSVFVLNIGIFFCWQLKSSLQVFNHERLHVWPTYSTTPVLFNSTKVNDLDLYGNKSCQKTTTLTGRQPSLNSSQGYSFSKEGQTSRSRGQKLRYHAKGLVTMNTHVQYESPITSDKKVITAYQRLFGGASNITPGGKVFTAILRDFLGKGE